MSKLSVIRGALQANPNAVIAKTYGFHRLPERLRYPTDDMIDSPGLGHYVYFAVAPKNGLYTVPELQSFMLGLIPDLTPDYKLNFTIHTDFRNRYHDSLRFGALFFEEVIGHERKSITQEVEITDGEFTFPGLVDGKQTTTKQIDDDYRRRIRVEVFPSPIIAHAKRVAQRHLDDEQPYTIPLYELRQYEEGSHFDQQVGSSAFSS